MIASNNWLSSAVSSLTIAESVSGINSPCDQSLIGVCLNLQNKFFAVLQQWPTDDDNFWIEARLKE